MHSDYCQGRLESRERREEKHGSHEPNKQFGCSNYLQMYVAGWWEERNKICQGLKVLLGKAGRGRGQARTECEIGWDITGLLNDLCYLSFFKCFHWLSVCCE